MDFLLSMLSSDLMFSDRTRTVLRFLIAGSIGAGVNVLLLYIFTATFGLWYIASATFSFILAYAVSFCLQKFWTFSDTSVDRIRGQLGVYFMVAVFNLIANNFILYTLVEYMHVWYLLAQTYTSAIIAVWSFIIYRLIFNKPSKYSLHSGN